MNTQRDNTEAYYSLHTANGGRTNVADPEPDQVGSETFYNQQTMNKNKKLGMKQNYLNFNKTNS